MKTKKVVKLVKEFLEKNQGQFYLDEIIYDCLGLKVSDQQFQEIELEISKYNRDLL